VVYSLALAFLSSSCNVMFAHTPIQNMDCWPAKSIVPSENLQTHQNICQYIQHIKYLSKIITFCFKFKIKQSQKWNLIKKLNQTYKFLPYNFRCHIYSVPEFLLVISWYQADYETQKQSYLNLHPFKWPILQHTR